VSSVRSRTPRFLIGVADAYRGPSRLAQGARLALSASAALASMALVVFHAALLWNQIGDGRLLDPAVATRWGVAVLLVGALAALRRAGVPMLWGRRALVVWVLVALLHWTASPASELAGLTHSSTHQAQVLVDLPSGPASALLLVITLFLLFLVGAHAGRPALRLVRIRRSDRAGTHSPILSLHLASRAPPVFA
jgi:hypothetical protein